MSSSSERTKLDRINTSLTLLEARSLSNTKPLFIKASTGTDFNVEAYALKAAGADVTFNKLQVDNLEGGSDDISNMTLVSGDTIYLNVSLVNISAGELVVYNR